MTAAAAGRRRGYVWEKGKEEEAAAETEKKKKKMAGDWVSLLLPFLLLVGRSSGGELPDFYSFTVDDIKGKPVSLEKYRGKVSLVVNVASQCGYTDTHYKSLKRLQDILSFKGKFNVLAFPCNQFDEQEPWENEVIEDFVTGQYAVEFPMFSKIDVTGENASPAFKNLIDQSSVAPDWNFYKYLVDVNGKVRKTWGTKVTTEELFDEVKALVDEAEEHMEGDTYKQQDKRSDKKDEL